MKKLILALMILSVHVQAFAQSYWEQEFNKGSAPEFVANAVRMGSCAQTGTRMVLNEVYLFTFNDQEGMYAFPFQSDDLQNLPGFIMEFVSEGKHLEYQLSRRNNGFSRVDASGDKYKYRTTSLGLMAEIQRADGTVEHCVFGGVIL